MTTLILVGHATSLLFMLKLCVYLCLCTRMSIHWRDVNFNS